jgi:hypothetical protein
MAELTQRGLGGDAEPPKYGTCSGAASNNSKHGTETTRAEQPR